MPGAGDLNRRLTFTCRAAKDDGYGNVQSGEFEPAFSLSAAVVPLKGGEQVIASRLAGMQPVVIKVRWCRQSRLIGSGWQAVDARSGETFDITSAADMDGKRMFIDILATSGLAQS